MALRLLACLGPASARTCARGGARGSGAQHPRASCPTGGGGAGAQAFVSRELASSQTSVPKATLLGRSGSRFPPRRLFRKQALSSWSRCPHAPPPPPSQGSPCSLRLGNSWGAKMEEWCWPAIPQMPAQLLRDLLAFWQMDTKWGTRPRRPLFPGFPPPSSFTPLLGLLSSRPVQALRPARGSAVGSSSPKPRRAKWRFCPLPPHRAPPRDDQGPPAPGEDAKS